MTKIWTTAALTAVLTLPAAACAQTTPRGTPIEIEISLANDTEQERATRDELRAILDTYDLSRWIYTTEVLIDGTQIPHSHPVLTLRSGPNDPEHELLSTFVHEQFHWLEEERRDERDAAMARFAEIFPNAPGREGNGARNQQSTYLHLIVCDLEFQAMTLLIGESAARELLGEMTHYEWIYEKVLNDPRIREVNEEFGFIVP